MIIHIDVSNRYYQGYYSVVAGVSVNSKNKKNQDLKKGIVITEPLREKLKKRYSLVGLHAGLTSMLIKGITIKKLIVCSDVNPVVNVLRCISNIKRIPLKKMKSIEELRDELGDQTISSSANAFARNINSNFPKRKNKHRRKKYFDDGTVIILENEQQKEFILLEKYLKKIKSEFKRDNR